MNIADMVIAYVLSGNPGMVHIIPDGKKAYFHIFGNLMYIEAPEGTTFKGMSDEAINRIVQVYFLALTDSFS